MMRRNAVPFLNCGAKVLLFFNLQKLIRCFLRNYFSATDVVSGTGLSGVVENITFSDIVHGCLWCTVFL
jgi:hypothetical protein